MLGFRHGSAISAMAGRADPPFRVDVLPPASGRWFCLDDPQPLRGREILHAPQELAERDHRGERGGLARLPPWVGAAAAGGTARAPFGPAAPSVRHIRPISRSPFAATRSAAPARPQTSFQSSCRVGPPCPSGTSRRRPKLGFSRLRGHASGQPGPSSDFLSGLCGFRSHLGCSYVGLSWRGVMIRLTEMLAAPAPDCPSRRDRVACLLVVVGILLRGCSRARQLSIDTLFHARYETIVSRGNTREWAENCEKS